MTVLLTRPAVNALQAYLKTYLPAQITAVSAAQPSEPALPAIQTWARMGRIAKPQAPTVYLLAQKTGFRGAQWGSILNEEHLFDIHVEAASQDEETLESYLQGYAAAIVNTIRLWWQQAATLPAGYQFLSFESPSSEDALDAVVYGDKGIVKGLLYGDVSIPITMSSQETG